MVAFSNRSIAVFTSLQITFWVLFVVYQFLLGRTVWITHSILNILEDIGETIAEELWKYPRPQKMDEYIEDKVYNEKLDFTSDDEEEEVDLDQWEEDRPDSPLWKCHDCGGGANMYRDGAGDGIWIVLHECLKNASPAFRKRMGRMLEEY